MIDMQDPVIAGPGGALYNHAGIPLFGCGTTDQNDQVRTSIHWGLKRNIDDFQGKYEGNATGSKG